MYHFRSTILSIARSGKDDVRVFAQRPRRSSPFRRRLGLTLAVALETEKKRRVHFFPLQWRRRGGGGHRRGRKRKKKNTNKWGEGKDIFALGKGFTNQKKARPFCTNFLF